jgi:choice-of-anchor A domain-containing protein
MTLKTKRARVAFVLTALYAPLIMFGSSPAQATQLLASNILDQFNAVVVGDFTTTSDVEGRLVAGTIENSASSTFYNNPNPSSAPSTFQAVNALTIQSCPGCNVDNGGGVNYVNSNSGAFNLNGGGKVVDSSPSFAMADFTAPLNALANRLDGLTANSTFASTSNSLVFNVTPVNGVAVFDMTAAQLAGDNYNITFTNETSASSIVINVTGNFTEGGGENFNGDTYLDDHVIWNFVNATALSFKTWSGAVLGGEASVKNSSPMNGFLYAKSFNGDGELHDYPFEGAVAAVPEPATWAMMIIGLGGIGVSIRRRRRTTAATA